MRGRFVETVLPPSFLADISSSNHEQAAERAAINAPMQGTAADLIKLAMLAVDQWLADDHRRPHHHAGAR